MTPARDPKQFVKDNSARAQTFSHIQSKADSRRQTKTCTNRYRETRHKEDSKLEKERDRERETATDGHKEQ